MPVRAAALLACLATSGCAADCSKACSNAGEVCSATFESLGRHFDTATCETDCHAVVDACDNPSDTLDCLARAGSCLELLDCRLCSTATPLVISRPGCALACLRSGSVCEREDSAAGRKLDIPLCASQCEGNALQCTNLKDQTSCTSRAATCDEAGACPRCTR